MFVSVIRIGYIFLPVFKAKHNYKKYEISLLQLESNTK